MKVAILYNAVTDDDSVAARDVLTQVQAVEAACQALGHHTTQLECTLNLETVENALFDNRPDVVFNLVESLGESDRLAHLLPALLESLDIPCTGNPAAALLLSNNKPLVKERLRAAGLATPDWVTLASCSMQSLAPPFIIKAVWEHASLGIDDHAIIRSGDGSTLPAQLESRSRQLGSECFAEQFIPGREFNIALLEPDPHISRDAAATANSPSNAPLILPPAEIDFSGFPADKPRIVGYDAKWSEQSFEFASTPRTFEFGDADTALLGRLKSAAEEAWTLLGLRGYARVDFRVDDAGTPWILEVNTNPCLSPDAGFVAALSQAGIPFPAAIEGLLTVALAAGGKGYLRALKGQTYLELPPPAACTPESTQASAEPRATDSPAKATLKTSRLPGTKLRYEVRPADCRAVRRIVDSTGLFRAGEMEVAAELVQARLDKGPASGYEFVLAQRGRHVVAYACYGRNSLTVSSFDLYWIAVEKRHQAAGLGRLLLEEVERHVAAAGGTRLYIETSHRADYQPTRGFYEKCGYVLEAVLEDFYAPGDGRAIYVKRIVPPA